MIQRRLLQLLSVCLLSSTALAVSLARPVNAHATDGPPDFEIFSQHVWQPMPLSQLLNWWTNIRTGAGPVEVPAANPGQRVVVTIGVQNYGNYFDPGYANTYDDILVVKFPSNVTVSQADFTPIGDGQGFDPAHGSVHNEFGLDHFGNTEGLYCNYSAPILGGNSAACGDTTFGYDSRLSSFLSVGLTLPTDVSSVTLMAYLDPKQELPQLTRHPEVAVPITINLPHLVTSFPDPTSPPSLVAAGTSFTYTASVTNIGGDSPSAVDLEVDLPKELITASVAASTSPSVCTYHHPELISPQRYVYCTFLSAPNQSTNTVTIDATAPSTAAALLTTATADPKGAIVESTRLDNGNASVTQVVQDITPPIVTPTPSRAPDSNGWYNHPLTVAWSGTDDVPTGVICDPATTFGGPDRANSTLVGTCTDTAGNAGSATFSLNYDSTPPQVSCAPADSWWHPSDVTIACTATDATSGLANPADASFTLSTNVAAGTETASASTNSLLVCDAAGNCVTAAVSNIKVDSAAPALSCGMPDGTWHATDVSISCTASDGGSGLANSADGSFRLSTHVPVGTETANANTDSYQVCDAVGNCATAGPIAGNRVDKAAPVINCAAPDTQWHGSDVVIACTATDGGSGLANASDASFTLATDVPSGTETAAATTGSRLVCDAVGNCATAGPFSNIKVDKQPPVVACTSADGAWHGADVVIACSASDGGSGLSNLSDASFGLSTNVPAGSENANALTGTRQVCDAVGNCATAGPIGGNKVDKAAPSIACGSADGLWHASDVTIACTASDGGSGLAMAADAKFGLSTNVAAGSETSNASTSSRPVCDAVGNCSTAGPIKGNKIDKKAPQTTATGSALPSAPGMPTVVVAVTSATVTPGGSLGAFTCWNSGGVAVNLASNDGGSGPASITYSITGAQATPSTIVAGASTSLTVSKLGSSTIRYFGTDRVGNVEAPNKLLILNGGLVSCATVPTSVQIATNGTVQLVGTITVTYGSTTSIKPFNVSFTFNLTPD